VQKCWCRFRVSVNCAKMLVVPNMKVLTIWGKLSSSSALGHYLRIFTDFEGDKSIHGWHYFWCQISSQSDHQRFVVLVVLSGGEITSLLCLAIYKFVKTNIPPRQQ
jgi:hypothetical protein